jgi:serine/threonine protein kinase
VALKVLIARVMEVSNELNFLRHLKQVSGTVGFKYVTELLDDFTHTSGPNGIHICLVFELMGPSVSTMIEELPSYKKYRDHRKYQYPIWMAKRILKQCLQGLEFLHTNGIAHGDLQPGNMLFGLNNMELIGADQLRQDENYKYGSISSPVRRKDGKTDKWAPGYLAVPQPLAELADIGPDFKIKLSDLGGG